MKRTIYRLVTRAWEARLPLPGVIQRNDLSIVCLHGVHTPDMEQICPPPTSSVSAKSFEANMAELAQSYRVVSLHEAVQMLTGEQPWRDRCAVLTFDDSLACTAHVAFPILARLGITATVFVSTAALGDAQPYWWLRLDHAFHRAKQSVANAVLPDGENKTILPGDYRSLARLKSILRRTAADQRDQIVADIERQLGVRLECPAEQFPYALTMNWEDVRTVTKLGFDVGSHTVTHPNLAILPIHEVRTELDKSKAEIEKHTRIPCRHLCYPYGAFTPFVVTAARECGFEAAVSTIAPGRNTRGEDIMALRRYGMPAVPGKLAYLLTGMPESIKRGKAALRGQRAIAKHA